MHLGDIAKANPCFPRSQFDASARGCERGRKGGSARPVFSRRVRYPRAVCRFFEKFPLNAQDANGDAVGTERRWTRRKTAGSDGHVIVPAMRASCLTRCNADGIVKRKRRRISFPQRKMNGRPYPIKGKATNHHHNIPRAREIQQEILAAAQAPKRKAPASSSLTFQCFYCNAASSTCYYHYFFTIIVSSAESNRDSIPYNILGGKILRRSKREREREREIAKKKSFRSNRLKINKRLNDIYIYIDSG